MNKTDYFASCLRAYIEYNRVTARPGALSQWVMYAEDLEEQGLMEEFAKYYEDQTRNDTELWNRLTAKKGFRNDRCN